MKKNNKTTDLLMKRLREMSGGLKIKLALGLSETVRRLNQDGQKSRRLA